MPIYAYRCAACGHSRDVLQKMSDPVLTVCPACGADQFLKQVTAAGFQLKGSGWSPPESRGGRAPAPGAAPAPGGAGAGAPAAAPAAVPAPAPASDGGGTSAASSSGAHGGGSCACH